MAATQHYMGTQGSTAKMVQPAREMSLGSFVRGFTRLIAVSLLAAGLGMWIAPGATNIPELLLMKLCASFFLMLVGLHLLFASRKPKSSD